MGMGGRLWECSAGFRDAPNVPNLGSLAWGHWNCLFSLPPRRTSWKFLVWKEFFLLGKQSLGSAWSLLEFQGGIMDLLLDMGFFFWGGSLAVLFGCSVGMFGSPVDDPAPGSFFFWKMGTATDGMRVRAGKPGNVKENREKSTIKHPNVGSGARNEGWKIYPGTIKAGPLPSWNSSSSALRERLSLAEARSSLGSGLASLPREKNSRISGMRALPEIPSLEHG